MTMAKHCPECGLKIKEAGDACSVVGADEPAALGWRRQRPQDERVGRAACVEAAEQGDGHG